MPSSEQELTIGAHLSVADGLATILISNPRKRNALEPTVLGAVRGAVVDANQAGARAIVIAGADGRFPSGADLSHLARRSEWESYDALAQRVYEVVEQSPAPVVAAIERHALGGALELALACHLRVAGLGSVFGFPEVSFGILPGAGGTQRLAAVAGRGCALDLILTGRRVAAEEAHALGVVTRLVAGGEALGEARALAAEIARHSAPAVRLAKDAVLTAGQPAGYAFERAAQALLFTQPDRAERIAAFLDR